MRKTPGGYGVRFLSLRGKGRRQMRWLLRARYGLRYLVDLPAEWAYGSERRTGVLYDLSGTGCFLAADIAGIGSGLPGRVGITIGSARVVTPARVIWVSGSGETDRPVGFGMQFSGRQKKLLRKVEEAKGPLEQSR